MSLLNNSNAIPTTGGDYNLENSLRFRKSAGASLSRTPTVTGNRTTWTFSCWVKRGELGSLTNRLIQAGANGTNDTAIFFGADSLTFFTRTSTSLIGYLISTPLYRDPSAWYHVVVAYDSTQATASNRVKMYINGEQITSFSTETYPPQNTDSYFNTNANLHTIGGATDNTASFYLDGYLTAINLIDGQALTASDFGDYNATTGVWQPIEYTGTYGTNGFYLPFKPTTQATGFNTVLYTGNGGTQSITGVGFSPDLIWTKDRNAAIPHILNDSVRGVSKTLYSNLTNAEANYPGFNVTSFNSDGMTVGDNSAGAYGSNGLSKNYVAWCWDAGSGSPVSNTDGTITSTVKANPATGFSVVTYTGNGVASTIGHGLNDVPAMIITKVRNNTGGNWGVYHKSIGNTGAVFLNVTNATSTSSLYWNNTTPTSSVFSVGSNNTDTNWNTYNFISYCFSEVAGYSKFGTYTGNGISNGPTVTTGFRPAFIMMKSTNATDSWAMVDNRRHPSNDPLCPTLLADGNAAELTAYPCVDFLDDGFKLVGNPDIHNYSGRNYIYMAFADTTDAQFNFDASGNHNNWTANNINSNASSDTTYDIMTDVPTLTDEDTANYATMNPLVRTAGTLTFSDGNLTNTFVSSWTIGLGTIALPTSGKFYWESTTVSGGNNLMFGLYNPTQNTAAASAYTHTGGAIFYFGNGNKYINGVASAYGAAFTTGDTIGVAVNLDANTITFYKNNVSQGAISFAANMIGIPLSPAFLGISSSAVVNFGQRPFKYTPPAGYLKLNTFNLPDSSIVDGSEYFNTVVYLGDGLSTKTIDTYEFSPDLVWVKNRGSTYNHILVDSVRGANHFLKSNETASEGTTPGNQFLSNGFEFESASVAWNQIGVSHVMWGWRGSDSTAVSNTDGTITSQVSANPTAGFSVVTYTGTGSAATVGHGLGVAPGMVIVKKRTGTIGTGFSNWMVWHNSIGAAQVLYLDTTSAVSTNASTFNSTAPTSSVFSLGTNTVSNENTATYVAYCFAEVEGYSKFGSYTGNGSADGPFVYTGFRPAFVLFKRSDSTGNWYIFDVQRNTYNLTNLTLFPNLSGAESTETNNILDILSNGFKHRGIGGFSNASGGTYIYMAFAESPFKVSLAR